MQGNLVVSKIKPAKMPGAHDAAFGTEKKFPAALHHIEAIVVEKWSAYFEGHRHAGPIHFGHYVVR